MGHPAPHRECFPARKNWTDEDRVDDLRLASVEDSVDVDAAGVEDSLELR